MRIQLRGVCYEIAEVVEVTDTACEKCGGALFVDREAVLQVTRRGFRGGRIFCVAGCTDVWLIEPARTMTGRAVKPPDGRGKYSRPVRTVSCRVCERPYQSRGTKRGRCKACRTEAQRTRDRLRRLPRLNPAATFTDATRRASTAVERVASRPASPSQDLELASRRSGQVGHSGRSPRWPTTKFRIDR